MQREAWKEHKERKDKSKEGRSEVDRIQEDKRERGIIKQCQSMDLLLISQIVIYVIVFCHVYIFLKML